MKKLMIFIVVLLFASPSIAIADEKEDMERLQRQINLLILEVEKLQRILTNQYSNKITADPLSVEEMRGVIGRGVEWFKAAQEENGHFKYEYLPYEDKYLDDDNMVRQAGGLYALGEIISHDVDNKHDLVETIERSISFFESISTEGEANGKKFRCISNSEFNSLCQLGATSLALVGVIDLVEARPDLKDKYDKLIKDYGAYIVAMKKPVGGFRGSYNAGSPLREGESSFSNGEAVLALVRLYKYSPSEEVKNIIDESFEYFRETDFDFPLYLWIMAALKDMQYLWGKESYVTYAKEYTDWRLNGMRYRKSSTHNYCAYSEGIISAYSVIEDSLKDIESKRYLMEIDFWLDKTISLQVGEKHIHRVLSDENGVRFGEITNKKQAFGGFLTGETKPTQRIDFTQHCLNSYLQKLVDVDKLGL